MNRLTNVVDAMGSPKFGYTASGQLQSEDGPWPEDTVSYTYQSRQRNGLSLTQPSASPAPAAQPSRSLLPLRALRPARCNTSFQNPAQYVGFWP